MKASLSERSLIVLLGKSGSLTAQSKPNTVVKARRTDIAIENIKQNNIPKAVKLLVKVIIPMFIPAKVRIALKNNMENITNISAISRITTGGRKICLILYRFQLIALNITFVKSCFL